MYTIKEKDLEKLSFDERGLIPAIIQDVENNEVLMMAYMSKDSLEKTISLGFTHFYSRSRQKLWKKGETSGNTQKVKEIYYDCDADTLLVKVFQKGVACHKGTRNCFSSPLVISNDKNRTDNNLGFPLELASIIEERKRNKPEGSYVASLFNKGQDKILKKIGEEAAEVIIGAKNNDKDEVIYESGDLLFHLLVLLVYMGIDYRDILKELEQRHGAK